MNKARNVRSRDIDRTSWIDGGGTRDSILIFVSIWAYEIIWYHPRMQPKIFYKKSFKFEMEKNALKMGQKSPKNHLKIIKNQ